MHTKGKKISLKAGPAARPTSAWSTFSSWDFHWQNQYFRKTPYELPGTSGLHIDCTWDNPTASTVRWGEGTSDEMCFAFVYATL